MAKPLIPLLVESNEDINGTPSPPEATIEVVCNSNALGTFQNSAGKWEVAVLKFDPETGKAFVEKTVPCGDKHDAEERFKILAAQLDIV